MKKIMMTAGLSMALISGAFAQNLLTENTLNSDDVLVVSFDLPAGGADIKAVVNSYDTHKYEHMVTGDTMEMTQSDAKTAVNAHFLNLNKENTINFYDYHNTKLIGTYSFFLSENHGKLMATPDTYTITMPGNASVGRYQDS